MKKSSQHCIEKLEELIEDAANVPTTPLDFAILMRENRSWRHELHEHGGHRHVLERWLTLGSNQHTLRQLSNIAENITGRVTSLLWADNSNSPTRCKVELLHQAAFDLYKKDERDLTFKEKEAVADKLSIITADVFALQNFVEDLNDYREEAKATLCRTTVHAGTVEALTEAAQMCENLSDMDLLPHPRTVEAFTLNRGTCAVQSLPAEIQIHALHDQRLGKFAMKPITRCKAILKKFQEAEGRMPTETELVNHVGPKLFCDVNALSFARMATIVEKYGKTSPKTDH